MTHYADMQLTNRPVDSLRHLAQNHKCCWTDPGHRINCLAHQAVENGNTALLDMILDRCHCEVRNKDGQTLLHRAAALGHLEIVRLILDRYHSHEQGMLDARDNAGNSALHYAAGSGRSTVASQLLDYGIPVNGRNGSGQTALHTAVVGKDFATVKVLCDCCQWVDCNAVSDSGSTPLHYAAIIGDSGVARLLVERGSWIGQVEYYGATPLEVAVAHHNIGSLESMLEAGALHLNADRMAKIWSGCLRLARHFCQSEQDQWRIRIAFANAACRDDLSELTLKIKEPPVVVDSREPIPVPISAG